MKIVLSPESGLESTRTVDCALALRGYERQAPTITMLLDLSILTSFQAGSLDSVREQVSLPVWLRAWYALSARPAQGFAVHAQVLSGLVPEKYLLLRRDEAGAPLCTAMAVSDGETVGLFGIATAMQHRSKGHATSVIGTLLCWARSRGARFAYLQVEESNDAAISLYRSLGFKDSYSYWYRVGRIQESKLGEELR